MKVNVRCILILKKMNEKGKHSTCHKSYPFPIRPPLYPVGVKNFHKTTRLRLKEQRLSDQRLLIPSLNDM